MKYFMITWSKTIEKTRWISIFYYGISHCKKKEYATHSWLIIHQTI